jgi:hypothetical protein
VEDAGADGGAASGKPHLAQRIVKFPKPPALDDSNVYCVGLR